ncbi:NAD(P)-binding protein [Actinomadura opuntiae]|uniref:NAD(P)-binding protein n=1 Tax=Actinomadura sp. OS1-43 TaxID=604315 RepID=UPI00255AC4B1|nr:NAD(P)-binding protein [Actinomadura sp. OS1-43]MDL4821822.1 NAD(P)-binding protein [Actinomadura sp. OS1-43]
MRDLSVLIIGAGFSGLGTAVALRREGIDDFAVLVRADDVGGTWRDHTCPGAACDIPSLLYSFSFAPNPGWSRTYSGSTEILAYIRRIADAHDLRRHITFGADVTGLGLPTHPRWVCPPPESAPATASNTKSTASCSPPDSTSGKPEHPSPSPAAAAATSPPNGTAAPRPTRASTSRAYPNLFITAGPDSGPGHNSLLVYSEAQINYIVHGIRTILHRNLATLDVKKNAQDTYNRRIQHRLTRTTWNSGCSSWYLTADGFNATMYPGFATRYKRQLDHLDLDHYYLSHTPAAEA